MAATVAAEVEETLQITKGQVGQLRAGPAATVSSRSGAQVLVQDQGDGDSPTVLLQGSKDSVAKAVKMLKVLIAFKESASSEERGVCPWFACGFCREGQRDGGDDCQAGVHSSKLATELQSRWLTPGKTVSSRPVLLALSTSGAGLPPPVSFGAPVQHSNSRISGGGGIGCPEEDLLELCIVAVDLESFIEVARFHRFVRPLQWDRQDEGMRKQYAETCFADETPAVPFTDTLADILDWLPGVLDVDIDDISPEDLLFVTARDWDIQTLLPRRCNVPEHGLVDQSLQDFFLARWCCLKDVFRSFFSLPNEAAPNNLRAMARHLGVRVHSALEQTRRSPSIDENSLLVRVTVELLKKGWEPKATAWRSSASAQTEFLLPSRGDALEGAPKMQKRDRKSVV